MPAQTKKLVLNQETLWHLTAGMRANNLSCETEDESCDIILTRSGMNCSAGSDCLTFSTNLCSQFPC
jgi:hypothetical protein